MSHRVANDAATRFQRRLPHHSTGKRASFDTARRPFDRMGEMRLGSLVTSSSCTTGRRRIPRRRGIRVLHEPRCEPSPSSRSTKWPRREFRRWHANPVPIDSFHRGRKLLERDSRIARVSSRHGSPSFAKRLVESLVSGLRQSQSPHPVHLRQDPPHVNLEAPRGRAWLTWKMEGTTCSDLDWS